MANDPHVSAQNPEKLFHITDASKLQEISSGGLKAKSYLSCIDLTEYYMGVVRDEGKTPVVLVAYFSDLSEDALFPDMPSIEEPITTAIGLSEYEIEVAWEASDQTWRDSLNLVKSVRYDRTIDPRVLRVVVDGIEQALLPEPPISRLDALIGSSYSIQKFANLALHVQRAILEYMADRELWDYFFEGANEVTDAVIAATLPRYIEKYGDDEFGVAQISTQDMKAAIMGDPEIAHDHRDWDSYHTWFCSTGVPDHPEADRWPVLLSAGEEETLEDGNHRFHSYVRAGAVTIPAVFFPEKRHFKAVKRKEQAEHEAINAIVKEVDCSRSGAAGLLRQFKGDVLLAAGYAKFQHLAFAIKPGHGSREDWNLASAQKFKELHRYRDGQIVSVEPAQEMPDECPGP